MNNNTAAALQVGEIFREAGTAFNKLSEMTMLLHPMGDTPQGFRELQISSDSTQESNEIQDLLGNVKGKWTEDEVEMLRSCVHRFAVDLNKISLHMKNRTTSQIRSTLKKKVFEDAGIPVRQVSSAVAASMMQLPKPQVTLNMLNATENEVDVEALTNDVKLEFETSTEEVPT